MYPQSMFWSNDTENWYTPHFYYIKAGFSGYLCHGHDGHPDAKRPNCVVTNLSFWYKLALSFKKNILRGCIKNKMWYYNNTSINESIKGR